MSNRVDQLLAALLNGETADITPQSRVETYLKALIEGSGVDDLPTPQSSSEAYLYALVEKGLSGGGSGGDDTGGLRLSDLTDLYAFFYNGHRLELLETPWDTSKATNFASMFYGCTGITGVPALNTRNGTNFSSMFYNCKALTEAPALDTSNGTNFANMFYGCTTMTKVPALDTSNGTDLNNMFEECKALIEAPALDTSKNTNFAGMFWHCAALKTVPSLDTSGGTQFGYMFAACNSLTKVPALDTRNGTVFDSMFNSSNSIMDIPRIDLRNATSVYSMFSNMNGLTNLGVYNIKQTLSLGGGTSSGQRLTLDSLINAIRELIDTGSAKTLTLGSTNLSKLANVYVRTVDVTDEMRAGDEFIDSKLPFEVCESTDEGATLITDYVLYKNWQLK